MSQRLDKLFEIHDRFPAILFEDDIDFSARDLLKLFRITSLVSSRYSLLHKFKEHRRLDARLIQSISILAIVIK